MATYHAQQIKAAAEIERLNLAIQSIEESIKSKKFSDAGVKRMRDLQEKHRAQISKLRNPKASN